ncbi:MAG: lactate utilization protein [Candidatus Altiarchaeota archaeon]|nr:lactate utilization protein [Candidatus Altiarchaeota archaeon]
MDVGMQGTKVKKLVYDPNMQKRLEKLRSDWEPYEKNRKKLLRENKELREKVGRERTSAINELDDITIETLKSLQDSGIDAFMAKNRGDAVNFMREIIGDRGLVIVPSTQITEVGVTQAFSLSNDFVMFSLDHSMCVKCGIPPMHPLLPTWEKPENIDPRKVEKEMKEKAKKAGVLVLSALCMSKDGSMALGEKEGKALEFMKKSVQDVFVIVGVDRLTKSEEACSDLTKLMSMSTGGLIEPAKPVEKKGLKMHVVLIDNGRVAISRTSSKDVLRCIHCYSCSLYCPVFWSVGYPYGPPEMAGIGVVTTNFREGIKRSIDRGLYYCVLCKRCVEECPVNIDIVTEHRKLRHKAKISNL